jgi:hypothetical protein
MVAIGYGGTTDIVTGVTYGAEEMTRLSYVVDLDGNVNPAVYLYYLVNPAVGIADVTIATNSSRFKGAAAVPIYNVNFDNLFGSPDDVADGLSSFEHSVSDTDPPEGIVIQLTAKDDIDSYVFDDSAIVITEQNFLTGTSPKTGNTQRLGWAYLPATTDPQVFDTSWAAACAFVSTAVGLNPALVEEPTHLRIHGRHRLLHYTTL